MPPRCCIDLLSVAEVFCTVIHFPLVLNLASPAPCITLKISPYVSSKIYQLSLLTQSNVYCFWALQSQYSWTASYIYFLQHHQNCQLNFDLWCLIIAMKMHGEKKPTTFISRYLSDSWNYHWNKKILTPTTPKMGTYISWTVNEHLNTRITYMRKNQYIVFYFNSMWN